MAQRVLKNGAIYDTEKKRIVAVKPELAEKNTQITSEKASDYLARRQEKKRAVMQAAAAAAVERDDYRTAYGSDAWIAAIAEAQYIKATTPDDPKSTDAARFLFQETGLSEAKQPQTQAQGVTLHIGADALQALASWIGGDNSYYRKHEVIDAIPAEAADDGTDAAPTTQEKR